MDMEAQFQTNTSPSPATLIHCCAIFLLSKWATNYHYWSIFCQASLKNFPVVILCIAIVFDFQNIIHLKYAFLGPAHLVPFWLVVVAFLMFFQQHIFDFF